MLLVDVEGWVVLVPLVDELIVPEALPPAEMPLPDVLRESGVVLELEGDDDVVLEEPYWLPEAVDELEGVDWVDDCVVSFFGDVTLEDVDGDPEVDDGWLDVEVVCACRPRTAAKRADVPQANDLTGVFIRGSVGGLPPVLPRTMRFASDRRAQPETGRISAMFVLR